MVGMIWIGNRNINERMCTAPGRRLAYFRMTSIWYIHGLTKRSQWPKRTWWRRSVVKPEWLGKRSSPWSTASFELITDKLSNEDAGEANIEFIMRMFLGLVEYVNPETKIIAGNGGYFRRWDTEYGLEWEWFWVVGIGWWVKNAPECAKIVLYSIFPPILS